MADYNSWRDTIYLLENKIVEHFGDPGIRNAMPEGNFRMEDNRIETLSPPRSLEHSALNSIHSEMDHSSAIRFGANFSFTVWL
jgi:hypothetical protein